MTHKKAVVAVIVNECSLRLSGKNNFKLSMYDEKIKLLDIVDNQISPVGKKPRSL